MIFGTVAGEHRPGRPARMWLNILELCGPPDTLQRSHKRGAAQKIMLTGGRIECDHTVRDAHRNREEKTFYCEDALWKAHGKRHFC